MVFICGVINIIITVTKIRKYIIKSIPRSLQNAIGGGIGIFVAYIGILNVGIVNFDGGVDVYKRQLIKLHMISFALLSRKNMDNLLEFSDKTNESVVVRFDPAVNRALTYAVAYGFVVQQLSLIHIYSNIRVSAGSPYGTDHHRERPAV